MTTRVFRSTYPGFTTLSYTAGDLITLLDKILVNGTSGVSVTSITRSGSTATVSHTSHGMPTGAWITVSGADQSEYNGSHQITVTGANAYTYEVSGTPVTPATGTITMGMTGAGWTKEYTGTNLAAYRQATHATNSNRFYLYVDNATTTTTAKIRGYETMSSISDTSGAAFPTTSQCATNYMALVASGAGKNWIALADERTIYLFLDYAGTLASEGGFFFGDLDQFDVNDNYAIGILGSGSSSSNYTDISGLVTSNTASSYFYIARDYSQGGTSITARKNSYGTDSTACGSTGVAYPNACDSKLLLSRVLFGDVSSTNIRGFMPGMYSPMHQCPLTNGDTFTGSGDLAGKRFIAVKSATNRQIIMEFGGSW